MKVATQCTLTTLLHQSPLHFDTMSDMPPTRPDPDSGNNQPPIDSSEIIEAIEACGFRLLEDCKIGGQGVVLKMVNTNLDRVAAVKIPHRLGTNAQRFEEEAKTLAKLSHVNIVNVYSFGLAQSDDSDRRFPYIEMEFIDGISLADVLKQKGLFDSKQAVKIVTAICNGLHEAHTHKIDHGDIKPDNILFRSSNQDRYDEPVIVDFGIARSSTHSGNRIAAGTPNYVAPEQESGKPVHQASDIYSVGKLLNELLTGSPNTKHDRSSTDSSVQIAPELQRIIQKCCERKPIDRFASANELADELKRYSANLPIKTGKTRLIHRAKLNLIRLRHWYLTFTAALLLIGGAVYLNANSNHNKAIEYQKELEGYAEEATAIEVQLRGKADTQDAQLVLLERLERKLSESSKKWNDSYILAAEHSRVLNQCAKIYRIVGDFDTALERNKTATQILSHVNDSSETELIRALAVSHQFRGLLMAEQEKFDIAIEDFQEMQRLFELAMQRPDNIWADWSNASSGALNKAVAMERIGKKTEALAAYVRARELLREKETENPYFEEDLAFIMNNESPIYVEMGLHKKAISMIKQSAEIRRRLFEEQPTHQTRKYELAQTSLNCGIVIIDTVYARADQQTSEDATKYLLESIELYRDLVEDNPQVVSYKSDLLKAMCCETTARYRDYALEHGKVGPGLDVSEDLAEIVELSQDFELDGDSTIGLSIFYLSAGRVSKNKELIDTAVAQFEMMANHYFDMAELQFHLGWAYEEADRFTAAEKGAVEFPASERAARKYGDAFKLKPECYKYYLSYRDAVKDQIKRLEESDDDSSPWIAELKKLENAEPLAVAQSESSDE